MGQSLQKSQQKFIKKLRKDVQIKNKSLYDLKTQHKQLIKQVIYPHNDLKKSKIQTLMHLNYQSFKCYECLEFFDNELRMPVMICKRQHSLCNMCIQKKTSNKNITEKCPQCSQIFQNLGKNRKLDHIVKNKQKILNLFTQNFSEILDQNKTFDPNSGIIQRKIIRLQKFFNCQSALEINDKMLLKTQKEDQWYSLRCKHPLPLYTITVSSFQIVQSVQNCIVFGVTPSWECYKKGCIFKNSVAFNLSNGGIMTAIPNSGKHEWRQNQSKQVQKIANISVSMIVDRCQKIIKWRINKQVYAQTTIPQSLFHKQLFIFISIFHMNDMILLNR